MRFRHPNKDHKSNKRNKREKKCYKLQQQLKQSNARSMPKYLQRRNHFVQFRQKCIHERIHWKNAIPETKMMRHIYVTL